MCQLYLNTVRKTTNNPKLIPEVPLLPHPSLSPAFVVLLLMLSYLCDLGQIISLTIPTKTEQLHFYLSHISGLINIVFEKEFQSFSESSVRVSNL